MLGTCFLVLGLLIYLLDRNLVPILAIPADTVLPVRFPIAGSTAGWAPSFLHALAFCLLSSGVTGGHVRNAIPICAFWSGTHIFLEIAQINGLNYLGALTSTLGLEDHLVAHYLQQYARVGVFDVMDLLAAMIGTAVAFSLIGITQGTATGDHDDRRGEQ